MIPTLYILCGVPGCGKTTWAREFVYQQFEKDIRYVSRDEIRFSIIKDEEDYFSHEKEVYWKFAETITETLIDGFDVIADATHLNEFSRRKLTQSIDRRYTDYEIVYVVFNVDLQTCLERNAQRTGRSCVPEQTIRNMYRDFRLPTKDEDERVKEIIEV